MKRKLSSKTPGAAQLYLDCGTRPVVNVPMAAQKPWCNPGTQRMSQPRPAPDICNLMTAGPRPPPLHCYMRIAEPVWPGHRHSRLRLQWQLFAWKGKSFGKSEP